MHKAMPVEDIYSAQSNATLMMMLMLHLDDDSHQHDTQTTPAEVSSTAATPPASAEAAQAAAGGDQALRPDAREVALFIRRSLAMASIKLPTLSTEKRERMLSTYRRLLREAYASIVERHLPGVSVDMT